MKVYMIRHNETGMFLSERTFNFRDGTYTNRWLIDRGRMFVSEDDARTHIALFAHRTTPSGDAASIVSFELNNPTVESQISL